MVIWGGSEGAITDLHWLANVDSFGIEEGFLKSKAFTVFRPFLKAFTEGKAQRCAHKTAKVLGAPVTRSQG